jgi:DNA polymerase
MTASAQSGRRRGGTGPLEALAAEVRALRLRLADAGRAGLAVVAPARYTQRPLQPQNDTRGTAPAASPERRAAEAVKEELQAAAHREPEGAPQEGQAPADEHLFQPGFDFGSPDLEDGASREEALRRVADEVAVCERCPELVANRTQTVPGQGNPDARLVFIGEGPGQEEDRQGLAFVGRAGQLLTKMIEAIDLTRDEVFICNILKCRPPENRNPTPEEAANCRPYLMRQLEILRPKVIVALGGVAAQNLLGTTDGVGRLRGRFYPFMSARLIPTYHPAYVLRNYTKDTRRKVYDDLLKAKEELLKD